MTPRTHLVRLAACHAAVSLAFGGTAFAGTLTLSQVPLFISTTEKANVLLVLDNSNSMDEDASGSAVGSANANSKSEIARSVAKSIVSNYTGKINLGLAAYQQSSVVAYHLYNSPYDISYDPGNYNPSFTGARESATKKYRIPNPTSAGNYIYYNVALPFYYSGSGLGNSFCYSTTAVAFNNGETYVNGSNVTPDGPWDYYRCFSVKTGTSDTLPTPPAPAPAPHATSCGAYCNNTVTATESANGYGTFQSGVYFYPTDSDLAQGISDFGRYMMSYYVSKTWFSNTSPGKGYLHIPIQTLDSTWAGYLNTKLGTSQFTTNQPTNTSYPLQNAGLTPMEGTLQTVKDYFGSSLSNTAEGYVSSGTFKTYPLPNSCGKNYTVMLTDGLPSSKPDGTIYATTSDALSKTADAALALHNAGVDTYLVGFALPYGISPTQLDTIAASGGTGQAYSATDTSSLSATLNTIFADILAKAGAAAAVATNSTALSTNSTIYQARFNSADWSGELLAYAINSDGTVASSPAWQAGAISWTVGSTTSTQTPDERNIFTYAPSNGDGTLFRWANLDSSQQTLLNKNSSGTNDGQGSARLGYLRGDASNEGSGSSNFRIRPASKLGDIIDSSPVYVAKPSAGYPDSLESASYAQFRADNLGRTAMIYAGGNDGMLHGFNASSGKEIMAYVPNAVFKNLSLLTAPTYSHRYYVNGSPTVADVFYGGAWHTVLVGTLAGGGQGVFALDVTSTGTFAESTANAQRLVLWEFTDTDNPATVNGSNPLVDGDANLGYTYGQPTVGKVCLAYSNAGGVTTCTSSKWVAIFGNGYNSTESDGAVGSGNAMLYVVDIQTGELLAKLDTLSGSFSPQFCPPATAGTCVSVPNGLGTPAAVDVDDDYIIDYVYAGDLRGQMWKFDLTGGKSAWKVAYGNSAHPEPLFTAKDSSGYVQPITTRPAVGRHPTASGYLVYFGTGKYLESTIDVQTSGTQRQSFYAIWDNGSEVTYSSRATTLQEQKVVAEPTVNSHQYRVSTANSIDWSTKQGWFMDLCNFGSDTGTSCTNYGEKQVSRPVLRNGRIIFTTLLPSTVACSAGGSSWLMELDALSGARLNTSPFDVNNDGVFTTSDFASGGGQTDVATSGTKLGDGAGIGGAPTIVWKDSQSEFKYSNLSSGDVSTTKENAGKGTGRISWRELVDQ